MKEKENSIAQYYLYVGAYTQGEDEGITIYRFDPSSGSLEYVSTASGVVNPSYLAISEDKKLLLAVNEVGEFDGLPSGAISAFAIDSQTGSLTYLNQVPTGGGAPCYVSMDKSSKYALVANYSGGNVAIFPIEGNGRLGAYTQLEQHAGKGPVKGRQAGPHAHTIVPDNQERFALAADLGIDQVITYQIDADGKGITKVGEFNTEPGAGPRHLAFHPNGNFAYIINELNSTLTSCAYSGSTGKLSEIATVSTLPEGFEGNNSCADIHVSKDGRFVYGSNRGHDSIVVFEMDQDNGGLTLKGHHSVKGKTPRNFMIDPSGKYLLVANQNSNNIVVFRRDEQTGLLSETGIEVQTSKPVCLKMLLAS
jgi:6-phosphogluconolactonase